MQEMSIPAFLHRNNGKLTIILPLPDSRHFESDCTWAKPGRSRKINSELRHLQSTLFRTDAGSDANETASKPVRLFFESRKSLNRTLKKYGRDDIQFEKAFYFSGETSFLCNARFWHTEYQKTYRP
jgi:hypothetical protein